MANNYADIPMQDAVVLPMAKIDFNSGCRIQFDDNGERYLLNIFDDDTETLLYSAETWPGCMVTTARKSYCRFRIEITHEEERTEYCMDLNRKDVLVQIPVDTLGDSIAWFSQVDAFRRKHDCHIAVVMRPQYSELFRKQYPNIAFVTTEEAEKRHPYATYYMGLFHREFREYNPVDYRLVPLHHSAACILGLEDDETNETPPMLDLSAPRQIKEKYAVIACKASTQCKFWNNPDGWKDVIAFLRQHGYRVLCIDKERVYGVPGHFNTMPEDAEDFTGNVPLQERVNIIKDADMFIGLPSGLSWLAWCCRVPVVMISGFSHPHSEFRTPYRVINYNVCNSCWNDGECRFDNNDFLWCPRLKGTAREYECTKLISSRQVMDKIRMVPGFK